MEITGERNIDVLPIYSFADQQSYFCPDNTAYRISNVMLNMRAVKEKCSVHSEFSYQRDYQRFATKSHSWFFLALHT